MLVAPAQAVALVRDLIDRVGRGELPGVPSVTVLRFSADGVTIEGPVEAGGRAVALAAQLLDALLTDAERPHELRVPGALRLALARATGTLDLPASGTLVAFADALARFAAPETADEIARALAEKCSVAESTAETEPAAPVFATDGDAPDRGTPVPSGSSTALAVFPALTISISARAPGDGLTLGDVAEMSGLLIRGCVSSNGETCGTGRWRGRPRAHPPPPCRGLDEEIRLGDGLSASAGERRPLGQPPTVTMPVAARCRSTRRPLGPRPPRATMPDRRGLGMAAAVAVLTIASAAAVATFRRPSPLRRPHRDATAGGDGRGASAIPGNGASARIAGAAACGSAEPGRSPTGRAPPDPGPSPPKACPGTRRYSPTFASAGSRCSTTPNRTVGARSCAPTPMRADDPPDHQHRRTAATTTRGRRPTEPGSPSDSDRDGERGVYVADVTAGTRGA